jgi:adenosylcobinamide-phosphate synthase
MLLDYTLFLSGTLASLLVALLLDAIVGDPDWIWRRIPHPVAWIGGLISGADKLLNFSGHRTINYVSGLVAILALVGLAGFIGIGMRWVSAQSLAGSVAMIVLAAILLAQKSLFTHVSRVKAALDEPDIKLARRAVAMIVGRNPETLDRSAISRAAIESTAENLSDGVIAPAFWFAVAGFPGLLIYKTVNTADSMIGHRNETYRRFGWAAARLDDLLNLVPARLTAVLLALCAPAVGGSPAKAILGGLREARWHGSPNAGWPEATTAYALGISLAGPRAYGAQHVDAPYFNASGRRDSDAADISRMLRLLVAVLVLHWLVYLGLYAALA